MWTGLARPSFCLQAGRFSPRFEGIASGGKGVGGPVECVGRDDSRHCRVHRQPGAQQGLFCASEGAMSHRSRARPGNFPIGSLASRAAARALLKGREEAANQEADVRIVCDLGIRESAGGVSRSLDAHGKVIEFIFPAHGECLGVFEVPPGTTVEEALRRAKARQRNSSFVIDLEPGLGRVFTQKPAQSQS
jgi:hypothetical protein